MPSLSPKARSAAAELTTAIADGNTRHVLDLVRDYGLSNGDRIAVAGELDRSARVPDAEHATLGFDRFDRAFTVADVWREDRA